MDEGVAGGSSLRGAHLYHVLLVSMTTLARGATEALWLERGERLVHLLDDLSRSYAAATVALRLAGDVLPGRGGTPRDPGTAALGVAVAELQGELDASPPVDLPAGLGAAREWLVLAVQAWESTWTGTGR